MYLFQKQIKYFDLRFKNGIDTYIFDGNGHKNFYTEKRHYTESHLLRNFKPVSDILRNNGMQIVFDLSNNNWLQNKLEADKLIIYLNLQKIPYEIIVTGGKGLRVNVYLQNKISQSSCFALYCYICNEAGIDWQTCGVPENKAEHHLVGTIGKRGKLGYYSTWLNFIPDKRPLTSLYDIKFPTELQTWNIDKKLLYNALEFANKIPIKIVNSTYQKFRYRKILSVVKW